MKLRLIVLSALTTGGAVDVIFDPASSIYPYATALLAIAQLILTSQAKDIDPGEAAQKHRAPLVVPCDAASARQQGSQMLG